MADKMQEDAWISDWSNIVRNIIFKDPYIRDLMVLPATIKMTDFITKYFIRTGTSSEVLKDEPVRIVYTMTPLYSEGENASINLLSFEIYVKDKYQHNYGNDIITPRSNLIALRLRQLLKKNRYNGVYRFYEPTEGDMHTSTVGYSRYNLSLKFTQVF